MKKITFIITTIFSALLISCSSSDGRDGIDGINGIDGKDGLDGTSESSVPQVFEFYPGGDAKWEMNSNFNRYQITYVPYPKDILLKPQDVILMYRLEQVLDGDIGLWRQMPQPYINNQGALFYNFDFTTTTFGVFLEAVNFDIANLEQMDLIESEVFQIVIIPSAYLNLSGKTDYSDLNSVLQSLGLDENDVQRID